MTVQVIDSVEWINQCYNHEKLHEHVSLYLVREGSDTILIDSGSFYHRDRIAADINDATDGTGPADVSVLSIRHWQIDHIRLGYTTTMTESSSRLMASVIITSLVSVITSRWTFLI
jgi:hypothetical protein